MVIGNGPFRCRAVSWNDPTKSVKVQCNLEENRTASADGIANASRLNQWGSKQGSQGFNAMIQLGKKQKIPEPSPMDWRSSILRAEALRERSTLGKVPFFWFVFWARKK
ncbi:MAG: hypothetical protein IPL46_30065 [Saprospiraceae bacterium]|nr:hypothetical protein [Saprospiraceae bacterium]